MNKPLRIAIIGAGNVATHFAHALHAAGHQLCAVHSATPAHAARLAQAVGAMAVPSLVALDPTLDLYLMSVKDDALPLIAQRMPATTGLWVHTTGSVGLEVLSAHHPACGVLYPLQTLSRERAIDFAQVPLYVEASDAATEERLMTLAHQLSQTVHPCNSKQRGVLHLAATFVCNFSNLMYDIGEQLLETHNLPADALHALIQETATKNMTMKAVEAQTGPAARADHATIRKHSALLEHKPEWLTLYQTLSDAIGKRQKEYKQQKNKIDNE